MPNNNIIIGIVGEIASGKGVAAEYLKQKYGAAVFKFSTSMRDVAARLYLDPTRENIQKVSTVLRAGFGDDIFAKVMAKDAATSDAPLIITDGIRRPSDIVELARLPNFHLIAITADERTRYERVKTRNENADDADKTWEEFQKDAAAETETKIRDIAAKAEYTVQNNGTMENFYKELDAIVDKIKNAA
jgi:dephospho-CoA kinase